MASRAASGDRWNKDWRDKRSTITHRNSDNGGFWKKILKKALRATGAKADSRSFVSRKDIVYLNLYLTSLEKKLLAIEEATQNNRHQRGDSEVQIKGDDVNPKQLRNRLGSNKGHELSNVERIESQSVMVLRDYDPNVIVKEMLFGYSENSPLFSKPAVLENSVYKVEKNTKRFLPKYLPAIKHFANTFTKPVEYHWAFLVEAAREFDSALWKATCAINYLDSDNKIIEIVYNNHEWDKRGTIVLKDLENQANPHELMGRVICFLLGFEEQENTT